MIELPIIIFGIFIYYFITLIMIKNKFKTINMIMVMSIMICFLSYSIYNFIVYEIPRLIDKQYDNITEEQCNNIWKYVGIEYTKDWACHTKVWLWQADCSNSYSEWRRDDQSKIRACKIKWQNNTTITRVWIRQYDIVLENAKNLEKKKIMDEKRKEMDKYNYSDEDFKIK